MNKTFPLLFLLSTLLLCCKTSQKPAQPDSQQLEIKSAINTYFNLLTQKDIDGAMDYIHPRLFEIMPRSAMVEGFEQLFSDTIYQFTFDSLNVKKVTPAIKVDDSKYARVDYEGYMTMHLAGQVDSFFISFLQAGLVSQFGKENVILIESPPAFSLHSEKTMIAIRAIDGKHWKFIESNQGMEEIFEQIIPAEVVEKLKL